MAGETDLAAILRSLRIERRDQPVTMVSVTEPVELGAGVEALIAEPRGTTVVVTLDEARRRGWPSDLELAWLTVDVHTSLEGVGLTAALSAALAHHGLPCNVLAGYFHDHLLVPLHRAEEAIQVLDALVDGGEPENRN